MAQRKLGRTADQRKALLRNQVTNLIWYGRIETTEARAKEVRRAAERLITLAVNECDNTIATTKEAHNDKGQIVTIETVNDAPSKLHARRIMMSSARTRTRPTGKSAPRMSNILWWRNCSVNMAPSSRSAMKKRSAPVVTPAFTSWDPAAATPPKCASSRSSDDRRGLAQRRDCCFCGGLSFYAKGSSVDKKIGDGYNLSAWGCKRFVAGAH